MNVQANKSVQLSSQVSNQTGSQLPVLPQQNGVPVSSQMQNIGNQPNLAKVRGCMQKKIYETILRKHRPTHEVQAKKLKDIVRRLEEGLFRSASSQEEYMNFDTLERRLHVLIKRQSPHRQRFPHQKNVSSVCKMIPTPGLSNEGNPNLMDIKQDNTSLICTEGNSSITSTINKVGSSHPTRNIASVALQNGFKSAGYQGKNLISDLVGQNLPSRMMPTPGIVTNGNHSPFKMESANTTNEFSTVNTATLPQKQLQHHHVGNQVGKQHKMYGYSNGSMGDRISDVHSKDVSYGSLSNPSQQHSDHSQQTLLQGDSYDLNSVKSSVPGNFFGTAEPKGSSLASQNLKSTAMFSVANLKSDLRTNQLKLLDPQPIDCLEKKNSLSSDTSKEILLQQQFCQRQCQPRQNQQQGLVKNEPNNTSNINSDLMVHVKSEPSSDPHSQVGKNNHVHELQNQFQHKSEYSNHNSQIQMTHAQHIISKSQMSSLSVEGKPVTLTMDQWQALPQDECHSSYDQYVQELSHGILKHDDAQCNDFSPGPSIVSQTLMPKSTGELVLSDGATCPVNSSRERSFVNQQKWILFLKHAQQCTGQEGRCRDVNCPTAQKLLKHVDQCSMVNCPYPRCHKTKILLGHYKTCKDQGCPVCVPVKTFLINHRKSAQLKLTKTESASSVLSSKSSTTDASDSFSPGLKRIKIEKSSESETFDYGKSTLSTLLLSKQDSVHDDVGLPLRCEFVDTKKEFLSNSVQENLMMNGVTKDEKDGFYNQRQPTRSVVLDETSKFVYQEAIKAENDISQPKQEISTLPMECVVKSGKPKIKGVSLIELFTPEQVSNHITGLRQWTGQSKAKAERNQAMENFMSENSCRLCAVERLTFDPPPLYCTPCGIRIKQNAVYYTLGVGDTRNLFCLPCYNDARGDSIAVDGNIVLKSRLEKKRNDEEAEEWWVQCDKCERWQHQICALFNGKRNDGGQAEYTCPQCYMDEIDQGERKPLPQSSVLGAKDLPRTILSDHIEARLNKRLKWEREERARVQGKSYCEVPSAETLVVRVVSSVDKKLEVKHRFLDLFQEDNYPKEFPYKSKVVLLFQKIEGVEVCLFGMYVQEFGADSQHPNQRRVYLSYLDSVKYFRPEIKAVTGEALRTFVYHEILIGYLEYCKKRGFTSCYIWACPPLKGEDYILYCHPEIQKTPKSDKLREWYLSMLQKASKENIVVELTNLYDHFFTSIGERKARVTAARLPYFEGDYWPGAAEDIIYQIQQEEEDKRLNNKGSAKKTATKRVKPSGQLDLPANASKDQLLMHKLGETIFPMKEDFIMVHLQHACTHCCILMVSGSRWVCGQCKNFQLCDKCYEAEQVRDKTKRHPVHHKEKHNLYRVEIADVPLDTKDKDEILESEFFDTRQAFLSLCQGNHYQYDTLRRAKHSSMMVLYHLHNPTAPAYVTSCNICNTDIDAGQGWRCEVCPEYDVCNSCYHKGADHPHKLTNHPSNVEPDAQNKEARQQRVLQLRKMLDLLVHASQCRSAICQYPNCCKVKGLFRHGITCKVKASGGCGVCKKMWYLLQLHARACKESECHVPRCKDLKIHTRRIQQQSESRRRAAVMEMMRQRAAEVAGNS